MTNNVFRKGLVIGIIILFVGASVLPVISANTEKINNLSSLEEVSIFQKRNISITEYPTDNLTISLKPMTFFFGVKIVLKNIGNEPLNNIDWTFDTTGGLFVRGGKGSGTKEKIEPDDEITIRLYPFPLAASSSPVGFGGIEMEATAQASTTDLKRTTAVALLFSRFTFFSKDEGNTAKYQFTFDATWSEETHPDDFPPNPHFSGLIGASHNDNVKFWDEGELASPGIKNMAETGSKDPLRSEINDAISDGTAFKLLGGGGINPSPGSVVIAFKVSEDYPLVSLVSMIAPSPDWFVGVDSLNLFENGAFVEEKIAVLYAYDAGTDSGTTYTSPNEPTDPPITIFKIEGYPFFYEDELVPLGTFTFTKISDEKI